jgi:outer membrane protein OmpA-like peptidoglycan-associated protein
MKYLILLSVCFFFHPLFAQWENECEWETGKKEQKLLEDAHAAYAKRLYNTAEEYALEITRKEELHPHARFVLGLCAYRKQKLNAAAGHMTMVIATCPDYSAMCYKILGLNAYGNDKYGEAAEHFRKAISLVFEDVMEEQETKDMLEDCEELHRISTANVPFSPIPISDLCTHEDEYLAAISPDNSSIYFTRRYEKDDKNSLVKVLVEEFTISENENGGYAKGKAMSYPFNQNLNEGGPTITADNRTMFFTICVPLATGGNNCDIYYTRMVDGFWEEIRPAGDSINHPTAWDSQPSVSADGTVLYFASSREGGQGGLDIYRSEKLPNGEWNKAVNLGPKINTESHEKSPFIHSDSRTLYFSSQGHLGMGGYDLFMCKELESGWSKPKNLGAPINTIEDELGMGVTLDGRYGYFSSNIHKGKGGWDIFKFSLYEEARPEKVVMVRGKLVDESGLPVYQAKVEVKNVETKEVQTIHIDTENGEYTAVFRKEEEEEMVMTIKTEGYTYASTEVKEDESGMVTKDLEVKKVVVGANATLDVNFETNSFALSQVSKTIIEAFAEFMVENAGVVVSIEGHTDNIGLAADNKALSEARAKAVYDFLLELGVAKHRMLYAGFGSAKPIASNDTEAGRSKNRRTVFVILDK